jgi:CRISPR-associated Csx2 family protein
MKTVLMSFLGRVPKTETGYRTTKYDFGDGGNEQPTAFFGWPLRQRIAPDRMVILGTAGSMWDHLFEGDERFGEAGDEALALIDAVENKSVGPEHLKPLIPRLAERLACDVQLLVIPYCRNEQEQVELLRIMSQQVNDGDQVHLDVTHGFRHLPMLAILSAMHLQVIRQARIKGIWYGSYDPDTRESPVYDLVGLLRIADWLQALHTYDKDGDYGPFGQLLGPAGGLLEKAAFFERTNNPVRARETLSAWASRADQFPVGDAAAALFSNALQERVSWYRGANRAVHETSLAKQYLDRQDFLRACIYGQEAVITAQVVKTGGKQNNYDDRESARLSLKENNADFRKFSKLRNALAHGVRAKDEKIRKMIENPVALAQALTDFFAKLH